MKVLTDATLHVRDCIYEGLLRRRDEKLTEEVARERANNLATAVIETLIAGLKAKLEAKATDEPPPVRPLADKVARHLEDLEEMEEHARKVIT